MHSCKVGAGRWVWRDSLLYSEKTSVVSALVNILCFVAEKS